MRAVLDVNVFVSAILAPRGTPARLILEWQSGAFDLIVSPALLEELRRVLRYPKISRLIRAQDAEAFVDLLARLAELAQDPSSEPPLRSADPDDDYLITLAAAEHALLVSGDGHLTDLAGSLPVKTPAEFLAMLG